MKTALFVLGFLGQILGQSTSDDFERASLGSNWSISFIGSTFTADQYCQAVIPLDVAPNWAHQVFVRRRSSDAARYGFGFDNDPTQAKYYKKWYFKFDGLPSQQTCYFGVTDLGPDAPKPGDTLRVEIRGYTLYGYWNGRLMSTVTDTAADRITNGVPGLAARIATGNQTLTQNSKVWEAWSGGSLTVAKSATLTVNNNAPMQTMDGFGATHLSLVYGKRDNLTPSQRTRAIKAVYGEVGINLGNTEGAILESPGDYASRANDNGDPAVFTWSGFQTEWADNMKSAIIDPARPLGFTDFSIAQKIIVRWSSPWLNTLKASNYKAYLEECAEQVAAGAIYHRDKLGITSQYLWLFNEPLNGNGELQGSPQDMVNIIKAAGARLRKEGFASIKFVVPNSETVNAAVSEVQAILADSVAKQYVGVIGYHPYPYGSKYSSVPNILATSGSGNPDAGEIAIRNQLRNLAKPYKIPVWMTEVSHGEVAYNSFDGLRGRAIHIHDELLYAGASAFFGMNNMWDETAQKDHFGGGSVFDETDVIALIENSRDSIHITSMGRAIGHYARWFKRGAVMLSSSSSDERIQVSAFRDTDQGNFVAVIINNNSTAQTIEIQLAGLPIDTAKGFRGEQSTSQAVWQPLTGDITNPWKVTVPAFSVTSLSAAIFKGGTTKIGGSSKNNQSHNFDPLNQFQLNGKQLPTLNRLNRRY